MKRIHWLAVGILVGLTGVVGADVARAGSVHEYGYSRDRGRRGWASVRTRQALLGELLRGDKKRIYDTYGYTPHRLRFNHAGRITERWRYYDRGLEFTFDEGSRLLETRRLERDVVRID